MISEILNSLKTDLGENPPVEVFFKDISQYGYVSQNPVAVLNFFGVEFENPPHESVLEQKGILDVSFFYFLRTVENKPEGVFEFLTRVRVLKGLTVKSFKVHSRKKNTSVWEIKAQVTRMF